MSRPAESERRRDTFPPLANWQLFPTQPPLPLCRSMHMHTRGFPANSWAELCTDSRDNAVAPVDPAQHITAAATCIDTLASVSAR